MKTLDIIKVAEAFAQNVFKLHELPNTIISDQESQFISEFWRILCTCLEIEAQLSTAYHPETDGQTENANMIMEQYLQMYCLYLQDNWEKWLSLAEFITNNTVNKSTGVTSFYVTYGQDP